MFSRFRTFRQTFDNRPDGFFAFLCASNFGIIGGIKDPTDDVGCALEAGNTELTVGLCNDAANTESVEFYTQVRGIRDNLFTTQRASVEPGRVGRFSVAPSPPPFDGPNMVGLGVIARNPTTNTEKSRLVSAIGTP